MIGFLILMWSGDLGPLKHSLSFPLDDELSSPIVSLADDGNVWVGDYRGHSVIQYDSSGHAKMRISYGNGQGPGEFQNPRTLLSLPEKNTLIVSCKTGKTLAFNYQDGAFRDNIISFLPYGSCQPWSDGQFIMIWCKQVQNQNAKDQFIVFDYNGQPTESWEVPQPMWQKDYIYDVPRGYAVASDKTVYIGYQGAPEVMVFEYKADVWSTWRVAAPNGYREPPERKIDQRKLYDREFLQEYMDSFSFIENLFMVSTGSGDHLVILWKNREPLPLTIDAYRLRDRQRVFANVALKGSLVASNQNRAAVLTHDLDGSFALSIYQWQGP